MNHTLDLAFAAANTHSVIVCGEPLIDENVWWEGDTEAQRLAAQDLDDETKLRLMTEYLEGTI